MEKDRGERKEGGGGRGRRHGTSSGVASEELFRRGITTPLMTLEKKLEPQGPKLGEFSQVFRERSLRQNRVPRSGPQLAAHFSSPARPRSAPKLPDGDFPKLARRLRPMDGGRKN